MSYDVHDTGIQASIHLCYHSDNFVRRFATSQTLSSENGGFWNAGTPKWFHRDASTEYGFLFFNDFATSDKLWANANGARTNSKTFTIMCDVQSVAWNIDDWDSANLYAKYSGGDHLFYYHLDDTALQIKHVCASSETSLVTSPQTGFSKGTINRMEWQIDQDTPTSPSNYYYRMWINGDKAIDLTRSSGVCNIANGYNGPRAHNAQGIWANYACFESSEYLKNRLWTNFFVLDMDEHTPTTINTIKIPGSTQPHVQYSAPRPKRYNIRGYTIGDIENDDYIIGEHMAHPSYPIYDKKEESAPTYPSSVAYAFDTLMRSQACVFLKSPWRNISGRIVSLDYPTQQGGLPNTLDLNMVIEEYYNNGLTTWGYWR